MATFGFDEIRHHLSSIIRYPDIKVITGSIALSFNWIFQDQGFTVLVIFSLVILDTITGLIKAVKKQQVSSQDFFGFAAKLIVYFITMITGALVDRIIPFAFALSLVNSFLAITEAISILENIAACGFPVPVKLLKILHVFEEKNKD